METINEFLYKIITDELDELELGHPFNYDRLSRIRATITLLTYLNYAVLSDNEIIRILESYEPF